MMRLLVRQPVLWVNLTLLFSLISAVTATNAATPNHGRTFYYANALYDDAGTSGSTCRQPDNSMCTLRSAIHAANGRNATVLLTPGAHYSVDQGSLPTLKSLTISDSSNLICPGGFTTTAVLDFSPNSGGLVLANKATLSGLTVAGSSGDAITVFGKNNILSCVLALNATKTGITLTNGAQKNMLSGIVAAGNGTYGIAVSGGRTRHNTIADSFAGYFPGRGIVPNALAGIVIREGANKNSLSTSVVGGNGTNGVEIAGGGTTANIVRDSGLGTDRQGGEAIPNTYAGISIRDAARNDLIQNNIISANTDGVEITGGGTNSNVLQGNHIGTSAASNVALANSNSGIAVKAGAAKTLIGGDKAGEGNIVSGNGHKGIEISGAGSDGSNIWGNIIGTDLAGGTALGNGTTGIAVILGARNTHIGGGRAGQGNVISGNGYTGIEVLGIGTNTTVIQGNRIGTNTGGTRAVPNANSGIVVEAGPVNTLIGGKLAGQGNIISGNGLRGIEILGVGTNLTIVQGNRIGTDASGMVALANADDGIGVLTGATNSIIGGSQSNQGNIISGNGGVGVHILNSGSTGTSIQGNRIGLAPTAKAIANAGSGVQIESGAANTTIGGVAAGMGNTIGGNGGDGISIIGAGSNATRVQGNVIGGDFANHRNGITITQGASGTIIGGLAVGEANRIVGNIAAGVEVAGDSTIANSIRGNAISGNRSFGIMLNYAPDAPDGVLGGAANGANNQAQRPMISSASVSTTLSVRGSANPFSWVDIYVAEGSSTPQGVTYLGTTTADSTGYFAFSGAPPAGIRVSSGMMLTATSTLNDPAFSEWRNSTSQFGRIFRLP